MEQPIPASAADQEQAIRELLYKLQVYQAETETLQQQGGIVEMSLGEIESTIQTITAMEKVKSGQEILVPVGAGTHVYGSVTRPDKFVIDIGAGISSEKNPEDTKKILETRKAELQRVYEQIVGRLTAVAGEIQRLQQEAQRYSKE